jgi:hypothetical protein
VKNFNQLLSTSGVWRNGVEGYVVSVCSNEVTEAWDFVTNTIVFLSSDQFERLASGGICTVNNDCMYTAPSPTATPIPDPTATPVPDPTATPRATMAPVPTATKVPDPTATPFPDPTTIPYYVYVMSSCKNELLTITARSNSAKIIGGTYDVVGFEIPFTIIQLSEGDYETTIGAANLCEGGKDECLLEGTQIKLSNGETARIETLKIGDVLYSNNIGNMPNTDNSSELLAWSENNPTVSSTTTVVKGVALKNTNRVLEFNQGLLTSSIFHLHVIKRDGTWIISEARSIKVGDIFISNNSTEHIITSIQELNGTFNVYKIDVEENDTYVANNIITHNRKIEEEEPR